MTLSIRRIGAAIGAACAVTLLPALAAAHPGHLGPHADMVAGLLHPVTGVDHLLALLAVGLWTQRQATDSQWVLPTAFVTAMLAGAGLAGLGVALPGVELSIAASVLALGVLVAGGWKMRMRLAAPLAALFAVGHGYAHVAEVGESASMAMYVVGFAATTLGLIAGGYGLGAAVERRGLQMLARVAGALVACAGAAFVAGLV